MTDAQLRPAFTASEADEPEANPPEAHRRRWPWLVGGLVAAAGLGLGAYAMSRGDDQPAAGPPAASAPARTGTEGVFAVTVTDTRCGVPEVGPEDLRQRAAGEFCLVSVDVTNVGREAELLDGGAQRAVDTHGKTYPVADGAAVFVNDQNPSLLEEIPAGATVRGVLPFDVPTGTSLAAVMVHESMTSRGVRVPLS